MSAQAKEKEPAAVRVADVHKAFPRRRPVEEILKRPFARQERLPALRGLSLTIRRGELFGLLGPNGAGKTTLLKILCGLVLPDQGTVDVLGVKAGHPALSRVLGLVHGDERSFYWRLTARENLNFFARLYGLGRDDRRRRVDELLARVDLEKDAERRFSDFSSGMRQRLAIARALLADPPVVLMDEPTRSLDPVSAGHLRQWVRAELHSKGGKTILLATHNLREAEEMCERVAVIAKGEVRAVDSPADLRQRGLGGLTYRLTVRGFSGKPLNAGRLLEQGCSTSGLTDLLIQLAGPESLDDILEEVRGTGGRILACAPETPDLEMVFRRLVEPGAEGEAP